MVSIAYFWGVTLFLVTKSIPDRAITSSNSMSVFTGADAFGRGAAIDGALARRPPPGDCAGEGAGKDSDPISIKPINRLFTRALRILVGAFSESRFRQG